jgi:hypothetical protein
VKPLLALAAFLVLAAPSPREKRLAQFQQRAAFYRCD